MLREKIKFYRQLEALTLPSPELTSSQALSKLILLNASQFLLA